MDLDSICAFIVIKYGEFFQEFHSFLKSFILSLNKGISALK